MLNFHKARKENEKPTSKDLALYAAYTMEGPSRGPSLMPSANEGNLNKSFNGLLIIKRVTSLICICITQILTDFTAN